MADADRPSTASALALAFGGVVVVILLFVTAGALIPEAAPPDYRSTPFPLPSGFSPAPAPSATKGKPAGPLPRYDGTLSRVKGRIKDRQAGLSYAKLDAPWQEASEEVRQFTARQAVVTENSGASLWYAEVASMPLDEDNQHAYTGPESLREVAEAQSRDLQITTHPTGSRREEVAGERLKVSGHKAWLTGFRLSFSDPRFRVTEETVVVVAVDTGKDRPGILYTAIPGSHEELRADINTVVESLRVL